MRPSLSTAGATSSQRMIFIPTSASPKSRFCCGLACFAGALLRWHGNRIASARCHWQRNRREQGAQRRVTDAQIDVADAGMAEHQAADFFVRGKAGWPAAFLAMKALCRIAHDLCEHRGMSAAS